MTQQIILIPYVLLPSYTHTLTYCELTFPQTHADTKASLYLLPLFVLLGDKKTFFSNNES